MVGLPALVGHPLLPGVMQARVADPFEFLMYQNTLPLADLPMTMKQSLGGATARYTRTEPPVKAALWATATDIVQVPGDSLGPLLASGRPVTPSSAFESHCE